MAKEEARNAGKVEPGTEIDVESEEFLKAAGGNRRHWAKHYKRSIKKYGA